jgi:hypothetical protein
VKSLAASTCLTDWPDQNAAVNRERTTRLPSVRTVVAGSDGSRRDGPIFVHEVNVGSNVLREEDMVTDVYLSLK